MSPVLQNIITWTPSQIYLSFYCQSVLVFIQLHVGEHRTQPEECPIA